MWCRRVQTLQKVKRRLDTFLSSRAVLQSSAGECTGGAGVGGKGLEYLRDGLQHILHVLATNLNTPIEGIGSELAKSEGGNADVEAEHRRVTAALKEMVSQGLRDASGGVTLAHHLYTTVCRALSPTALPPRQPKPIAPIEASRRSPAPTSVSRRPALQAPSPKPSPAPPAVERKASPKLLPSGEDERVAEAMRAKEAAQGMAATLQAQLRDVKAELLQERQDCCYYRDLSDSLRRTSEELQQVTHDA